MPVIAELLTASSGPNHVLHLYSDSRDSGLGTRDCTRLIVMSANCHLLALPDEVLLSMAIKLSLVDLLSLNHSCRRFFILISQSSLMQYLIRTMRNGLHDPLITDTSIPQRIKSLEIWERAWLDLTVSEPSQCFQLSAIGLDDPKRCTVQSGILIGTQFNNIHLSGAYHYLDYLHLLNQPKAVTRTDVPNISGDAYVQSWAYVPESDLMAIIFQSVSNSSHSMVKARINRLCAIDQIDDVAPLNYNSINSLQAAGIQVPQIIVWNLIMSRSLEPPAWSVAETTWSHLYSMERGREMGLATIYS